MDEMTRHSGDNAAELDRLYQHWSDADAVADAQSYENDYLNGVAYRCWVRHQEALAKQPTKRMVAIGDSETITLSKEYFNQVAKDFPVHMQNVHFGGHILAWYFQAGGVTIPRDILEAE